MELLKARHALSIGRLLVVVAIVSCWAVILSPEPARASDISVYTYDYYDGALMARSAADDDYAGTHDNASADTVDYGGTGYYVGQDTTGVTPNRIYTIWRGMLYFNTTALPTNASVSSATIKLYGKTDMSTTDFDITIVRGAELATPPVVTNYGDLLDETGARAAVVDTASFTTTDYNSFALNTDGLGDIVAGGVSKFGIRSSNDISSTLPSDSTPEYVEFWSSEGPGAKRPVLQITYTIPSLTTPDTFGISYVKVFENYIQDNDFLFVFNYMVIYENQPNEDPGDVFNITLYDGAILKAISPLAAWGYKPGSLYVASGLNWGDDYTLKITGRADYFTGTPPEVTYTLQANDWVGDTLTILDAWVRVSARLMEDYYNQEWLTELSGTYVLNDIGGAAFKLGISYLDTVRPDLFQYTETSHQWDTTASGDSPGIDEDLGDYSNLGGSIIASLEDTGDMFDMDGKVLGGLIFALLMIGVVAVVTAKCHDATPGLICGLMILFMGDRMGVFPMALTAVIGVIAAILLLRELWLKGI